MAQTGTGLGGGHVRQSLGYTRGMLGDLSVEGKWKVEAKREFFVPLLASSSHADATNHWMLQTPFSGER